MPLPCSLRQCLCANRCRSHFQTSALFSCSRMCGKLCTGSTVHQRDLRDAHRNLLSLKLAKLCLAIRGRCFGRRKSAASCIVKCGQSQINCQVGQIDILCCCCHHGQFKKIVTQFCGISWTDQVPPSTYKSLFRCRLVIHSLVESC